MLPQVRAPRWPSGSLPGTGDAAEMLGGPFQTLALQLRATEVSTFGWGAPITTLAECGSTQ